MSEASSTFACFEKLPTEIRLYTWELAEHESQTVSVRSSEASEVDTTKQKSDEHSYRFAHKIDPRLHTCFESRKVALKLYEPLFENSLGQRIHINPTSDVLSFNDIDQHLAFQQGPGGTEARANIQYVETGFAMNLEEDDFSGGLAFVIMMNYEKLEYIYLAWHVVAPEVLSEATQGQLRVIRTYVEEYKASDMLTYFDGTRPSMH